MEQQTIFDDVEVGQALDGFEVVPSKVQMMRYCAVTWNMHRIHFDEVYAEQEGYPGVLVQSHLHQGFLTQLVTDWMGPAGRIVSLEATNRRFAIAGQTLTLRGTVTAVEPIDDQRGRVHLDIEEVRLADDTVCVPGSAVVELPTRAACDAIVAGRAA
ncbi:MaoC/PaaZ C-terminal domain-containing protein [Microbacterium gorillae]|uniref:MaoC/PaaZ C-terminal domain-containing protein n=1 Tax=Microbacterium gorillae TaxID=1231063 RepID=UPI000591771D|nr:MaoC/PaaZ C-terminal domain-containing protein [Microbacterium gorillae]